MGYYDNEKNISQYIKMLAEYDNTIIIEEVKKYLKKDMRILELGSGAGKDYEILSKEYDIIASDYTEIFLSILQQKFGQENVIKIDAGVINKYEEFDFIYSNKVLQHVEELKESFKSQSRALKKNGLVFHTLWLGEGMEIYDDLKFYYYDEESIQRCYEEYFEIVEYKIYSENEEGDSFFIVLKKK